MFARVSHARYPPEHRAAGLRIVRQELLPAFHQIPGYQGCTLLISGRPGSGLAVVLWDSEEAADAASAERTVVAAHVQLAALGLVIEARQLFEVVVHDRGDVH